MHFSWGLVFEFGRSAAADLGGSYKISLEMSAGNVQNSNLLFSKVGLVQSLSNLSPKFLMLEVLNPLTLRVLIIEIIPTDFNK